MSKSVDLMKLSLSERLQLVEDLWDSIVAEDPESLSLSPEQKSELQRRLEAHSADPSTAIDWEEIRADLLQQPH